MKKILFLFLVFSSFISCSDSNEINNSVDAPLLEKVIFNASSSSLNQRIWNFNNNGLLNEITNGDGTVLYTFTYDSNERVSQFTMLNNSGTSTNFSFTYNTDGSIATLNNVALNYDNTLQAYYFGDLNASYNIFKLNSDGLLTYNKVGFVEIENGISYTFINSEANITYDRSNLKGHSFHNGTFAGFEHDNKINPLRNATMSVFKAIAVTSINESWLNSFAVSTNNVNRKNFPFEYFIHEEYVYEFNSDDLPISATLNFYENNTLDFSTLKTLYYYQGN